MRAVVAYAARDLRVEDREEPAPGPGEVTVRVGAGGICGSDLHYYNHGGFGAVRLREPMILGHEIAGTVVALGPDVQALHLGQKVAVNPSRACGTCSYCRRGLQNHCMDMRFYGSAMRFPHVQGGFRDLLTCAADQAVPVPDHVSLNEAAMAEPLAVCLHAVRRAGPLLGARVLVAGTGPIGILIVAAARLAGAGEIVATDIAAGPLGVAATMGADRTINVAEDAPALDDYEGDKGRFDIMFEAAGVASTLLSGLRVVRPRGTLVQVGQGAEATLPMSLIVTKELEVRGTFRFHEEFVWAVDAIAARRIDVRPLLTAVLPVEEASRAFDLANDKGRSVKVQLAFA